MEHLFSAMATLAVLLALSGIVPLAAIGPAAAAEIQALQIARSLPAPQPPPFEASAIEELTLESNFTVYMREDCPPELRQQALRKLWSLLPSPPIADNAAY